MIRTYQLFQSRCRDSVLRKNHTASDNEIEGYLFQSRCRDSVLRKEKASHVVSPNRARVSVPLPGFSIEKAEEIEFYYSIYTRVSVPLPGFSIEKVSSFS